MAILKPEFDFNFKPISTLITQFPSLGGSLLSFVGSRSRGMLYNKYLKGQELTLSSLDKKGKVYPVMSDVNKRQNSVKIYSFATNLFERGRKLRNGNNERGKYIITKKLKADIAMRTAGYASSWENKYLKKKFKEYGIT